MQVTLYEAAQEVRELLEQVDPETGELSEGYEQARALVATKATAVACWVAENDMQAAAVEAHCKALMQRVKAAKKRSEWMRGYLASHMAACGITSLQSADKSLTIKLEPGRDESVEVYQPELLPRELLRVVPETVEPDKPAIKAMLKAGKDVQGARLVKRDRLVIR